MGAARTSVIGVLALLVLALLAPAAHAASPLKIREAYPGSTASPQAEYMQLQMTAAGQNDVDGQSLRFYNATGTETASFTIPSDVANGESQRAVLLATSEASAVGALPDFTLPSADRMSPAGGAVCLTGAGLGKEDCLTWGSIPIFGFGSGFPDRQTANASPGGITNAKALRRSILPGCATYLDAADDSANSALDFAEVTPAPKNNSITPTETRCPPDTFITVFPPNPTNETAAFFEYAESPAEAGVSFECALDWDGALEPSDFSSCPEAGISYPGPLAEGTHRFAARAIGEGGGDPTPKTYSWLIDTTPPETAIDSSPPEPSGGFSASFTYSSSEPSSSFRCQLDDGAIQVCADGGKTYFTLADGTHVFRVWATDNAGNQDPTPAERSFSVQGVLIDQTPPDTAITAAPPNPSAKDSATFAYAANEAGSTFQCSLDGSAFASCPATGQSYTRLRNGNHTFAVRATDRAGNVDSLPATFAWRVAAPLPRVTFAKAPPGRVALRSGTKAKLTFELKADKPGSSFRCRLDKAPFKACKATVKLKASLGRHRFEAYAVDSLGNRGTQIARRIFRVQKQKSGGLF